MTTLTLNAKAPDVELPTNGGGHFSLKEQCQKGMKTIIYFYPKDDTPGCTLEAQQFRDLTKEFAAAQAVIVGISKDSVASHDKFKTKQALNFALASDESGDVCERYGVWVEKNMYGKKYMGVQRATFLIGSDGKIAAIWPKVKPEDHAAEVLEATRAL